MKTKRPDSEDILRLIDELSSESAYTDEESRAALEEAGIDPQRFTRVVRRDIRHVLRPRKSHEPWEALRSWAVATMAVAALLFVVVFHLNYRAGAEAQRQLARAQ